MLLLFSLGIVFIVGGLSARSVRAAERASESSRRARQRVQSWMPREA